MSLQVGIVGLPNVGKSTLFRALTAKKVEAANYPFCTIDPNVGVVTVPDVRLDKMTEIFKPQRVLPTTVEFVDIAGLVAGASKGEGLGNQFLSHIRSTDAIVHVVRCFEDSNIIHVSGSVDPLRDVDIINTELILSDLETVVKKRTTHEKVAKLSTDPKIKTQAGVYDKLFDALGKGTPARALEWTEDEKIFVSELHMITQKPVLYVCNVKEEDISNEDQPLVQKVYKLAKEENARALMVCSALEAEISELPPAEQKEFMESSGIKEPGLHHLIREAYTLLGLNTYFTAGEKEVRAWTIDKGTRAPGAAGKIHSDFEKGFIRAEAYNYDDLLKYGTEQAVKEAGKYRVEGKDYVVKDGDLLFFRFNV